MPLVLYEKKDRIAYITLNRPEKLNALSPELISELAKIWVTFRDDDEAWVSIFTGAGKAFCSGVDIASDVEMLTLLGGKPPARVMSWMKEAPAWRASPTTYGISKPIIAAINGHCLGGGLWLALESDIRIASEVAQFGVPEPKLGMPASFTALFRHYVPPGIASEMLITCDRINAQRAYEVGLVNRVVSSEHLIQNAIEMAQRICQNSPLAIRAVKELILKSKDMNRTDAMALTDQVMHNLLGSADIMEGFLAFVEKRKPVWKVK
ncbi:MAG: hypothetical protein APR62_13570 [Smithella sp. SDB]|nr:MAG: hypothetical protein APR62_13570 [Smithella sp. SDB]